MNDMEFEATAIEKLPQSVCSKLGYYVYLYLDPRDNKPFYVGKGVGNRILDHIDVSGASDKGRKLDELRALGEAPNLVIARHHLSESEASL